MQQRRIIVSNRTAQKKLKPELVVKLYEEMKTVEEIAKRFDVSSPTILKVLKQNNVKMRTRWDYEKQ